MNDEIPLLALMGPTGGGKTDLALRLDPAQFEVVSCDSRQIYQGLALLSAAPTIEERQRMPHHLVEAIAPTERADAARFVELADAAIADIRARGKRPVIVGGAGFYFRALTRGLFQVQTDLSARAAVQAMGAEEQLARLRELDPAALAAPGEAAAAGRIHNNDAYRIGRALEIAMSGGPRWSELWKEKKSQQAWRYRFRGYFLRWSLADLAPRLEQRARRMVDAGVAVEVKAVLDHYGLCPGLEIIGASEALANALGELDDQRLAEALFLAHRQYARAQLKWFQREAELQPVDFETMAAQIAAGKV